MVGQWEWIILLVIFLGFLVWELVRVKGAIRKAGKRSPDTKPERPRNP